MKNALSIVVDQSVAVVDQSVAEDRESTSWYILTGRYTEKTAVYCVYCCC